MQYQPNKEIAMKKSAWMFVSLLSLAGAAFAQNAPLEGISESTDPSKVADVERRAQDLASRQQTSTSGASSATGSGAASDAMPGRSGKARKGKMRRGARSDASGGSR
jgi:hypothetical protein